MTLVCHVLPRYTCEEVVQKSNDFLGYGPLALIKLKARRGRCAEENIAVRTVCLPPPEHRLRPGVTCEICGYGKEKQGTRKHDQLHGNTNYNNAWTYFVKSSHTLIKQTVLPVIKYLLVPLKVWFCGFILLFPPHRLVVQISVPTRSSGEHPCWWCVSTWGLLCKQDHRQHVLCQSSRLEPRCLPGIPNKSRLAGLGFFATQNALLIVFLTGRLRRAACMQGRPQALAVWSDQLGRGLCKGVSSGRLHQGDQLQPVDRGENRAVVYHSWLPALPQLKSQTRPWTDLVTLSITFMRHNQYKYWRVSR